MFENWKKKEYETNLNQKNVANVTKDGYESNDHEVRTPKPKKKKEMQSPRSHQISQKNLVFSALLIKCSSNMFLHISQVHWDLQTTLSDVFLTTFFSTPLWKGHN